MTCDFQQCGILTSVHSDEPVQPSFELRNSKCCSDRSLRVIEYSSDYLELWSDCAQAQAGLTLCWSHIPHCWESHVVAQIENTMWVSFDIKLTKQGFENACWHREACRAIQHTFSKPSLVNLISKDANLVFIYQFAHCFTLLTSDYDVIFDYFFVVDSAALATSFKKYNVIMPW